MGLNLVLYDLNKEKEAPIEMWDWLDRRMEDRSFVEWLDHGNATYRLIGDSDHIDSLSKHLDETPGADALLARIQGAHIDGQALRAMYDGEIYARPKHFDAARAWVHEHVAAYDGSMHAHREQKRLLEFLDLLEANANFRIYVSGW